MLNLKAGPVDTSIGPWHACTALRVENRAGEAIMRGSMAVLRLTRALAQLGRRARWVGGLVGGGWQHWNAGAESLL